MPKIVYHTRPYAIHTSLSELCPDLHLLIKACYPSWDRIYQGQDNLSNQRLGCSIFTCTSLLWLMPIHIVPPEPQPSLAKSRLVSVMQVSDWPQIWDSRLYMKFFLRFMLLCCGELYVKTNMEKSPTAFGHWPYEPVLIQPPLTWSDLNYWN